MIDNSTFLLQNIALDLDRISTSLNRNSFTVAERFVQEVINQQKQIGNSGLPDYIKKILSALPQALSQQESKQKADDALMYSILLQNFVAKNTLDKPLKNS